ncbi:MAG: methionyl-tRNA formyltransferase [Bacteroidia bacterium]|nr:methionyl-tRNA formyltransferase [Bacteroidia bacterium]MCF8425269.1 methionyl-tRNA formyltransferase [Bacteroidia bacterium]MCF8446509.1 methionyl-tRNA formyltransferase [Bacteroidia bacterium]
MRIIFLGTPDFAVESLRAIVDAGFNVVGVITAPDKPAGRGMQLQQSPVKKFAEERNLHVMQPEKLRDPNFIEELKSLKADLQVVIAFRMLPEIVWNMPPLGTINLHASLLPDYRGAAPINWAIINGETKSGVSTFFLKHEIDTGDILQKAEIEITPETTAGILHDELMHLGAKVIVDSLNLIKQGKTQGTPQGENSTKIAPKIFKEHCLIHWNQNGEKIINLIRGMNPYPAAFMVFADKNMKVFRAQFEQDSTNSSELGSWQSDHKTYLKIKCSDGWISLLEVQMESKKRMEIVEFLRGYKLQK